MTNSIDDLAKDLAKVFETQVKGSFAAHQSTLANTQESMKRMMIEHIQHHLNKVDVLQFVKDHVTEQLSSKLIDYTFPQQSIPANAIKQSELVITGDQVIGGLIKQFESTGIQDKASGCIVTIMDNATVIENKLVVAEMQVAGSVVIDGDLVIKGQVPVDCGFFKNLVQYTSLDVLKGIEEGLFAKIRDQISTNIRDAGLDLKKITIDGKEIITGNKLGYGVVDSNLQRIGVLNELQVSGETDLGGTVYVGKKRVGINTMEPDATFSLWDEEVQVTVGKRKADTALIQAPRQQVLVLGSNNKDNLALYPDGTVVVKALQVGKTIHTSGATKPATNAPKGVIVWNEDPNIGQYIGWVSLGGGRWAGFGKIE